MPTTFDIRSIPGRLMMAFLVFLALTVGLGTYSINGLGKANQVATEIRQVWLHSTRLIGDLNKHMASLRAAEGEHLLANASIELIDIEKRIADRRFNIEKAIQDYRGAELGPDRAELLEVFERAWDDYLSASDHTLALSRNGDKAAAALEFRENTRAPFRVATEALDRLADLNMIGARDAAGSASEQFERSRSLTILLIVLEVALVICFVVVINFDISQPILDLAETMNRLAANDTDVSIYSTRRTDEIGEIARSVLVFRDNAKALAISRRELAENAEALSTALRSERRLTRQQRNFVSMASHEFRTPLNIIDGHAQRAIKMRDRMTPEEFAERMGKIRAAVKGMIALMDNILGAPGLTDEIVLKPEPYSLPQLIRDAAQLHREMARGVSISVELDALPETMLGDRRLMERVFGNLISNALKYGGPTPTIDIRGVAIGGEVRVSVRDHGIGIPDEDQQHLFERYFRARNATGIAGTGVGLNLVQEIVVMHGGRIELESRLDQGSCFTVCLPIDNERILGNCSEAA